MTLLQFRPCTSRPLRELPPRVFPTTPNRPQPLCAGDDEKDDSLYRVPVVGPTDTEVSYLMTSNGSPRRRVRSTVTARVPVCEWTQTDLEAVIQDVFSTYDIVCAEYRIRIGGRGQRLVEACGDERGHRPAGRAGTVHETYVRFLAPLSMTLCRELISSTNRFQIACTLRVEAAGEPATRPTPTGPAAIAPDGGAR